ncbi:MAG: hypothetical protein HYV07_21210 [Deltaproteobacteria bacterium]|nr:hypothetical protein [Deltaproteobacteria bacterium]
MTPEEVIRSTALLAGHLRRERELRDQLLELEPLAKDARACARAIAQQRDYVRQIEDLRQEKILPLVEEMVAFVATRKQEIAVANAHRRLEVKKRAVERTGPRGPKKEAPKVLHRASSVRASVSPTSASA